MTEKTPLKSKAKYMFSSIPNTFLGCALVGMMKHFLNRGRYRIRVRGQGLAPGENWRHHMFGQPLSKSTHLRIYIEDKVNEGTEQEVHTA